MLLGNRKPYDPEKDEQYTPKWLFDCLNTEFDLDVAAPTNGSPNVPSRKYYTKNDDGLIKPWNGFVWMNPPYSNSKPWVSKFMTHKNGIALLPFSKAQWMVELWTNASAICLVNKIKFERANNETNEIFMPTALFAMGTKGVNILENSKINRVR